MEITAIVVARAGSKRIKGKNMLPVQGETLVARKIRQLRECKRIDRVVFGSDSDEMIEEAKNTGAEVVKRPDYYCDESLASANDMIENMCSLVSTDVVVWAHCTNPLISSGTYDKAVETFLRNRSKYDSLLSVAKLQEHMWTPEYKPLNYNPYAERHVPAKYLPVYYYQDGGIFIQPYLQMKENKYFFGRKPYLFLTPANEVADINTMRDYYWTLFLLECAEVLKNEGNNERFA